MTSETYIGMRRKNRIVALTALVGLNVLVMLLAISVGAVDVSVDALWGDDSASRAIFFDIRAPRILVAGFVGAILAMAGLTFQTLLRNPLADPFILGVSGGAACGAAITTALGLARVPGVVPLVAFAGATLATLAVFVLARKHGEVEPARLLLAGLVLNAFFSALILLALSLVRGSDLTAALRWMMGTFFSATWKDAGLLGIVTMACFVTLTVLANDLRAFTFGEEDARSRGVDTRVVKRVAFLTASMATGAAVAASGIIGFVGLLVPHGIRLLTKHDFRGLLPLSALGGSALLIAADACARTWFAPSELPIGALTALLGVPFFLAILRKA